MKKNFKKYLLIFSVTAAAAMSLAACGHAHEHSFQEGWSYDNTNHWHESDCGHDVKDGLAKHSFTENVIKQASCTEEGSATYTCACGYSYTAALPTVAHTYDTERWTAGALTHWHACGLCGDKKDEAEHTFVQGVCSACNAKEDGLFATVFVFEEDGDDYVVAGLTKEGAAYTKLTVPALYNGKSVTAIKANAFEGSAATEITVHASVTAIERETFLNCAALTKVELPETVKEIKDTAFAGCAALKEINLPAGLTAIGWFAFDGCAALEEIELPDGLTALGKQAFANCTSLTEVNVPAAITQIADRTFFRCTALETVTFAGDVTDIGIFAFADCSSLASITLPNTLKFIGQGAFMGSGLTSVVVPDSVSTLSVEAFADCAALTNATLPGNLNMHYGKIFAGCAALEEIVIPFVGSNVSAEDAVTTEFGYLFGVNAPENESAFTKVGNYYIPNSLKTITVKNGTIVDGAFDDCAHLETVHVEGNVLLNAVEFTNFTATIHVLGAPEVKELTLASSAYANEAAALTYRVTHGSAVEIIVKKGTDNAVLGTDYVLNADKTQITFKTEGTFTVTVKATLNNLTAERSANVEIAFRGPELTNVSLDKTAINAEESVVLSYEIDNESEVVVTVKKGDQTAVAGTDYTYAEATKTYTFNVAGAYTITVSATRNGKTVSRTLTLAVADTTVNAPVITFSADRTSVEEGTAVALTANVAYDTEHGDAEGTKTYEVFVQDGTKFVNADENFYEFNTDHMSFTPLVAGVYQIKLTVNSAKGQTADEAVTVTATLVEITLTWTTQATVNGWLRYALEGGDIVYAVTGYTGGYAVTYTADNAVVSAGAATNGTGVRVSATESNTATVKVTYTHKSDSSVKKELTMPVSFVSDLENAPILGEDPFGGTYGTLIPSTGLMLYFDVKDKNNTALTYNDITYEIVSTDLKKSDGTALDTVSINKLYDMNDYPFILVENFENNTATGTVTVKLTATKDGAVAAATKVFTVTPLVKDSAGGKNVEGLNAYADRVFDRGAMNFDKIASFDTRQNMVLSKEGFISNRAWANGNMFCVEPNANNFQLDFTYTVMQRTGDRNKASFTVNYRMGNWDSWNSDQTSFYAESEATTTSAGYWGASNKTDWSSNLPDATIGKVILARLTHTVTDGIVTFHWQWSEDGTTYNDWLKYTVNESTENKNMGARVSAMQFNFEQGSFRIGGITLTHLEA